MKFRIVLLGCIVSLTACSGDEGSGSNPNGSTADTGSDVTSPEPDMGSNNVTPDMPETPEDTGPSDVGPADVTTDMSDEPDLVDMAMPDLPEQMCFHPTMDPDCPMGEFGPGTFLDFIEVDESQTCCRDFTGDGNINNKIGQYVNILRGTGQFVNANIDAAVRTGSLVYLFEYANWANETTDPDLDMRALVGVDDDLDFTDNLAGTGQFLVRPESFDMNGDPKWEFDSVSVSNGHLVAIGGELDLFFPNLLDEVRLLVRDVRIEADVVPPADLVAGGTVALENGEISGALDRNLFFDSMNEAAASCECIGRPVFTYDPADDEYTCDITAEDQQACEEDPTTSSGCQFLSNTQGCQFLEFASTDVDVDVDNDGTLDSFSVGVRFTGVGASIVGPAN